MMIDLKTLYEQTTLYCDLITRQKTYDYFIEVYRQPDTPIYIFAYFDRDTHTLVSIAYTIKKGK